MLIIKALVLFCKGLIKNLNYKKTRRWDFSQVAFWVRPVLALPAGAAPTSGVIRLQFLFTADAAIAVIFYPSLALAVIPSALGLAVVISAGMASLVAITSAAAAIIAAAINRKARSARDLKSPKKVGILGLGLGRNQGQNGRRNDNGAERQKQKVPHNSSSSGANCFGQSCFLVPS